MTVLTTGFWPIPATPACTLPDEARAACNAFTKYYVGIHSGRRLTWQSSLGTAELRCIFDTGRKELIVHTYQMCKNHASVHQRTCVLNGEGGMRVARCDTRMMIFVCFCVCLYLLGILMLFNTCDKYTYAEIEKATNIPPAELTRHLLSLAHPHVRILKKLPNNKTIAADHKFMYNTKYTSKLFRNKIPLLSKQVVQPINPQTPSEPTGETGVPPAVLEARKNRYEHTMRQRQTD